MKLIPVFAFGTRGDVAPVITILHRLVCSANDPSVKFVLVTHQCYVAESLRVFDSKAVKVLGIDSVPVAVESNACFSQNYIARLQEKFKGATIVMVVANLFALDAWLLAEEWNVKCIFIHPNLPQSEPHSRHSVLSAMESTHPHIYQCLQQHPFVTEQQRVCWTDYQEILWPTLVSECATKDESQTNVPMQGPVLLLLTSPKFSPPPLDRPWLTRYHTCGFIASSSVMASLHLEGPQRMDAIPALPSAIAVKTIAYHNDAVVVLSTTAELLMELAVVSDTDNSTVPTVCVDFGSMTQVLVEQDRLCRILDIVKQLAVSWRFVIVCHGYAAHVEKYLLNIPVAHIGICHSIVLMRHSMEHAALFPKCVTVVHHGGIGTVGTCLHCGVPQLILAVMYDQMANGARVQELQMGECIYYDSLDEDASSTPSSTARDFSTSEVTALVEQLLRRCCNPVQRLRCACYGRDLRADPAEDGLANALAVLDQYLHPFLHHPDQHQGKTTFRIRDGTHAHHSATDSRNDEYVMNEYGRLLLPNGLQLYTHFDAAPEETVFLYEEIFVHEVYSAAVKALQPGDLVVDIGANIGMFSMFAVHAHRGNGNYYNGSGQQRMLAVEPMRASYDLLVKNAQYHRLSCVAYNCAIGAGDLSGAVTTNDVSPVLVDIVCSSHGLNTHEQLSTIATKEMRYYPRLPGNSCSADKVESNMATQAQVMNPSVLNSACNSAVTERCPVMSLSAVLDDYFHHRCGSETVKAAEPDSARGTKRTAGRAFDAALDSAVPTTSATTGFEDTSPRRRIALLKVDVEGDELGVLQSLNAAHWVCIYRVIVEAAHNLEQSIVDLLCGVGFSRDRIVCDSGGGIAAVTGNVIIFATRR